MVRAGSWCEACEPYDIKDIDEWYDSDVNLLGDGFWLKVEGDSMTSPIGQSIPEGHMVLVDTGREPVNGSLVVAKLTDANEATFKKLVIDGGQKYLKGLNPSWPMTLSTGTARLSVLSWKRGKIRMIRIAALLSILLTTSANSECWIVTNLHGYGSMNGDRYEFTKDSTEDSVFHVTINGDKSSVYESVSGVYPEMKYTALSSNTMVGEYQSGGGITVETWSITTDKKLFTPK